MFPVGARCVQAYRQNVFPPSTELSGAITQVLNYRQTLLAEFSDLTKRTTDTLTLGEPPCIVIAGDASAERVTIVTYDELFRRVRRLVDLLEETLR